MKKRCKYESWRQRKRLALEAIKNGVDMKKSADYQQKKVREESRHGGSTVAIAIMQCYRHCTSRAETSSLPTEAKLGHTTIELPNTSDSPGDGQQYIRRALRDQKKLLSAGDQPDAPAFVRDQDSAEEQRLHLDAGSTQ